MPTSKIALITGANRGLGLETAKQLADKVTTVILTGRNQAQLDQAVAAWPQSNISTLVLDVEDQNSINQAVAAVTERYGKLDILINNAGIMVEDDWMSNNATTVSAQQLQKTFNVNLFGVVAVTQAFLPLLEKSDQASIVSVSSLLGSLATQADVTSDIAIVKPIAYNASKSALNAYTIHLAQALADSNIKVNSAHPGWVRTELGTDAAPLAIENGVDTMIELALIDRNGPNGGFFHQGETVAW